MPHLMRVRRFRPAVLVGGALLLLAAVPLVSAASQIITLAPGDALTVDCSTRLTVHQHGSQQATLNCEPSDQPPPPAPGVGPGIPACLHDSTKWHGLAEYNADGSILCTYGHEHKEDPRVLDYLFGPLEYGEISYPWETPMENHNKHQVYGWSVVHDVSCTPTNAPYGFTSARLQSHNDGNGGATTRFHSFLFQGEVCDPNDASWRGKISIGGHMDFGRLVVKTRTGEVHVPLPGDPQGGDMSLRRVHGTTDSPRYDFTWYGANRTTSKGLGVLLDVGIRQQDWGPIAPNDPSKPLFYGGNQNGSWHEPLHVVGLRIDSGLDALDGVRDGFVTYDGYTDRHGNIVQGCTTVGVDCVPLKLENMKVGSYQFRAPSNGVNVRDHDVKGPDGNSLIQYPN